MAAVTVTESGMMRGEHSGSRSGAGAWVAMVAVAVLLVIAASLAMERLREYPLFPLHTIRFEGDLAHVAEPALRSAVAPQLHGGLLFVDVTAVRRAVESVPWVAEAAVWRVWPQSLRIRVTEHQPIAAWGNDGLVTADGHVFEPRKRPVGLPRLDGPQGSAKRVIAKFAALRKQLGRIDLRLLGLRQNERRAWQARLAGNTVLRLGRNDLNTRLQRLITAWSEVRKRAGERQVAALDLRYPNGFAVEWAKQQHKGNARKDTQR